MALLEINAALLCTFFIGILLVLTYWSRWRRYFELGMKLPGPPALPIVGNCFQFTSNDLCKLFQEIREIGQTYAPIFRVWIGPVLVVGLADADYIESVVKYDKICRRGYLQRKVIKPFFQHGLLDIDGDQWRRHRKLVSAALHINILETFVENFAKNSDILANNLKALANGVTAHDILPFLKLCTLNVTVQTSYKMETNPLTGNDNSTLNNLTTIIDITVMRLLKPWLYIDWIFKTTDLGKTYYKAMECEHGKMNTEIRRIKKMRETAEKRGQNDKKPSLMELLIQYGDTNDEEIVGEIATILTAGSDTTSTACGYVLALLGENQHIQARVMEEQQDIFGDDILRPVRRDDLPRMVYLEQVLKETMRLFPPVAVHLREAINEIDLGHGHIIPAGTNIFVSAFHTHRDPRHFPDPEKFDPDRFSPQNSAGRHPYVYIPFGLGRRMCVGQVFANMEAKTILSTLLRRYCITEIEGGIKGFEQTLKISFVMSPANGIRVKLLPRSHPSQIGAT